MDDFYKITASINRGDQLSENDAASLEIYLDELVKKIQECEKFVYAESSLYDLGMFQHQLAILLFKFDVSLKPRLVRLVREFDRFDDYGERLRMFNKIKKEGF